MGPRRTKQLSNFAKLFGKKSDAAKVVDIEKTPVLNKAAEKLADKPITEEELKAVNRALLKEKGIEPNSLRQLVEAPNTIEDPELKKWAFDLHRKWDASNKKIQESKLDEVLKNVQKSQEQRATSGYKLFEEGAPTSQEMRLRKLKEFSEEIAEGVKDIDISSLSNFGKKAAAISALTAGGGAAASLMPEEAEAGAPRLLSRKEVAAAMKAATREGKPDITALFKSLGAVGTSDEHLIRGSNILDHLIFEKTGLPETRAMDAVQLAYPEFKKLKKIGETKKPDLYGRIIIPESEIGGTLRRDPLSAKLLINPELKTRIGESALLAHEAQHLRDAINTPSIQSLAHPKTIEDEIKNVREILNASPEKKEAARQQIKQFFKRDPLKNQENLSFDDINDLYLLGKKTSNKIIPTLLDPIEFPQVMTHRHHVEYPKNYEWEKTKELAEEGVRPVNESELFKKMQEVSSDYKAAAKKTRGSVAGLMAAAGVGAGSVVAPAKAQAGALPKKLSLEEIQKKYGVSEKEIGESLQTAGEFLAPFSKLMMFLTPTETVSEAEEEAELRKIKENKERALLNLSQNISK